MKHVKRLALLSISAMILLFVAACGGGASDTNETADNGEDTTTSSGSTDKLMISTFLPGTHLINDELIPGLFDDFEAQSEGNIEYELYADNLLGEADAQYDMAVTGEADVSMSVHGYTPGRFPLVTIMELPFLVESAENGSRIIQRLLEEFPELQEEFSDTSPLFMGSFQAAQIVSKDHKIEKPEDLKGLRVRTPSPMGNKILENLGATPVSMPMGEVYEALERGVIDAGLIPMETLYNYGLEEVTNYITVGDFSASTFFFTMNPDTYAGLSDTNKDLLMELMGEEAAGKAGKIVDEDAERGREVSLEKGAEIIDLSGDSLKPWQDALDSVVQEWISDMEENGLPGEEIYARALELKEELEN